ncbi:Transcription factor of morphogeneis MCM1 [Fusarium oxysporum f. sp. albedinis]|nr:Transcription factor of morphogeneis MCM1 [Fusarium oxysporum f. sp. albedinis]
MSHAHSPIPFIYESEIRLKRLKGNIYLFLLHCAILIGYRGRGFAPPQCNYMSCSPPILPKLSHSHH